MEKFDLDTVLLEFRNNKGISSWKIREAVEGVQVFGGIGSGKTSGSGRALALQYLSHNFGGLILTAKESEKEMWEEFCQLTGRYNDLVILEPDGKEFFNILEWESRSTRGDRALSENIADVLKTVIRASEDKNGARGDDNFWETALDMTISNVIDLCLLAYGKISLQLMYEIVLSAPKKKEDEVDIVNRILTKTPFNKAFESMQRCVDWQVEQWQKWLSPTELKNLKDPEIFEREVLAAIPDARSMRFVDQYFIETYRNLSEKTRSIIEYSFSGFLFRLLKEPVYSLFFRHESTITPDDCLNGKIILLNLPVKKYQKVGRDAQIMVKYVWQRAMEKRNINLNKRPVFLWADEAQNFLHPHDTNYQATARSSRIITTYISQNMPNYLASMGGAKSEHLVNSFLGTLGTKIFHANADPITNKFASDLIGEAYVKDESETVTTSGTFSMSDSSSYKLEKMVRPEEFVILKTGGPLNNFNVGAYIHKQGSPFHTGFNHIETCFNQNYKI